MDKYLKTVSLINRKNYGDITVRVDYGKKENRARSADDITFEEFLSVYNSSDRYLVDTLPKPLWGDFSLLRCLLCGGFTSGLQVNCKFYLLKESRVFSGSEKGSIEGF